MYKNKHLLLVLSLLIFAQFANSQNNTNSPYTRFGYGDISDNNNGEQKAMGGVSIGSRSSSSINTVNPASYSSVDSMTFMFDIGSAALLSRFKDGNGSTSKFNANLEYITMQFPLSKTMGFSAGVLPYSFSGYDFRKDSVILNNTNTSAFDSINTTRSFIGSGGFTQVYTGLSIKLLKHLSLGVNAYYMFGNIYNYRDLSFNSMTTNTISSANYPESTQSNYITAHNFRFRFGAQYFTSVANKHDLTIGLIYENKTALSSKYTQMNTGVLSDTTTTNPGFQLPTIYGVGINYCYNRKLTIGIDYSMQEWKNAQYFGKTDSLNNRSKLAIGIEYQPNYNGRKFSDRVRYRAGFNITDPYYNLGTSQPKNYSLTCGLGLPLYNRANNTISMLNASIEYGKIGSSVLSEEYFKFNFNITFNEHWFMKRKL